MSGLTPLHHGLRNNGAGSFPDGRATLATALSKAGFSTGAFVGSFVLDHRFGLARGFDVYDDEIERDPNASGLAVPGLCRWARERADASKLPDGRLSILLAGGRRSPGGPRSRA